MSEFTDAQIKHMVEQFLRWKLPEDFRPDCGISFVRDYNVNTPHPAVHEPVGTNLFDYTQAKAMVLHMLDGLPRQSEAVAFDAADWFWRVMDPDDNADTPAEAIHRSMVGLYCVCEIASSYTGPTRYGFVAPVLDPESDDEEFLHFATQEEAVSAAHERRQAVSALPPAD